MISVFRSTEQGGARQQGQPWDRVQKPGASAFKMELALRQNPRLRPQSSGGFGSPRACRKSAFCKSAGPLLTATEQTLQASYSL